VTSKHGIIINRVHLCTSFFVLFTLNIIQVHIFHTQFIRIQNKRHHVYRRRDEVSLSIANKSGANFSNFTSDCCLSGKVHQGTPNGSIETIDGLQTYVAAPKDGSKAKTIVFLVSKVLGEPFPMSHCCQNPATFTPLSRVFLICN
jgi:hypothetical protein